MRIEGYVPPVRRVHLVNTLYVLPEVRSLEGRAEARGVTILPEFGLDPGIDLVLLGEVVRQLDEVDGIRSYGAGMPLLSRRANTAAFKAAESSFLKTFMRSTSRAWEAWKPTRTAMR